MRKYAFAMPGKIGDLLYILPTIHKICERDRAVADVYTSEVCRPAERLFRYQKHINDFIIPDDYKIRDEGQGIQPWFMKIPPSYDWTFQLGYEHFPQGPLHQYIAKRAGVYPVEDPQYNFIDKSFSVEPYILINHCASRSSEDMYSVYKYFIDRCPIKTIQTGAPKDWVEGSSINLTGLDLFETLPLFAHARAFIGFYSAPLVLANGFPGLLKIITMWPGVGEQHGLHISKTIDLAFPTGESLLKTVLENL